MKIFKISSIIILSCLFMGAFIPSLSAKSHKYRSTSFSLNFNVGRPCYAPVPVVAPVPVAYAAPAPAYVERTTIVQPYSPVVRERIYYPSPCYREVIIQRPYAERVYVHPQYSYYSSWGY